MSLVKRFLGIPQNIEEFIEKARRDEQQNVRFSLEMVNTTMDLITDAKQYRVRMYLCYQDGSKKTKVFETTSELFVLSGLIPEEGRKYLEFEEDMIKKRNRIRERVIGAGVGFEDPIRYKQDPLMAGV